MNLDQFQALETEPAKFTIALRALWQAARDDWDRAHALVQDDHSKESAWVHAYLHRKEGDIANARYWYMRAGRPEFRGGLDEEWSEIARALLEEAE